MKTKWFKVAKVDTVPAQEGRRIHFKSQEFALFNLGDGEFKALDGHCPHKQGPLADGIIAGNAVFCPLHNWKISLETGCALTQGPGSVRTYPTKVIGKDVYIAFNDGQLHPCEETGVTSLDKEEDEMEIANQ